MNTTYIVKHIQKGLALLPALVAFMGGPGCGAWGVASAGELVLAERGRPAAYTIVRPAQASASEVYAAEELRDGLARATGVTLPITADDRPLPDKAIVIGAAACARAAAFAPDLATRLGEDGFRLEVRGTRLFVYGSAARGALYGVYALLEGHAGCRWYASWHTLCPPRAHVAVPDDLAETQVPAFAMREPYWYDVLKHPAFAARLRVNSRSWRTMDARYGGNPFRFGGGLGSCHTFNTLMPPDEFFDAHPEYFSYEDGRRVKHPSQLCLTNPDVLRIVTERVLERIRKDPGAKFYGVSQNDYLHYCQCDACRAVDEEEGSHAGTMVRFVNAVAEAVEKEFPDVLIETLAYQYTRKPPKKTRLRHNVVPCLCTIECDFARPLDASTYPENISFRDDIAGWSRMTDQLYVWDYTTDFPNYTLPFANVLTLQGNLKFFRAHGVREIFAQGSYQGRHGDFAELKAWLLAKWMWNPDLPPGPLLDDFFSGYYGKGAPFVRAYFDELHRLQAAYSTPSNCPLSIWTGPENPALSDAFLERAAGLWAKAAEAVRDDPATSYNVRMGAFSVDYARLERMRRAEDKALCLAACAPNPSPLRQCQALARSLLARMDEAKDIRLAERRERHEEIVKAWRALLARTPAQMKAGAAQIRQSESDDSLVVEYDKKTGSFTVVDVEGGRTWRSLSGESPDKDIQVDYKIEGREVVVELKADPEKPLQTLDFPRPFAAERGDRILLTQGNGFLFPAEMTDLGTDLIDYSHYPSRNMEMGCFGHFSGKTGYLAIIETPEDCGQRYKIGENGLRQPNVVWNGQWKKFGYTRRIRFVFFREATPMKMALRYREEMKRKGYYKLFGEKMKEKPALAKRYSMLAGAPNIWMWNEESNKAKFARELKRLGFDTFIMQGITRRDLGAWITPEDISELAKIPGVLPGMYDIYNDFMDPENLPLVDSVRPYWPTNVWQNGDYKLLDSGAVARGWRVNRKDGKGTIGCVIMCEARSWPYAKENLARDLQAAPHAVRLFDVVGGGLGECYNPRHTLTCRQSKVVRHEFFENVEREFNMLAGTEDGSECFVNCCSYFEGTMSAPNHYRVDSGRFMWKIYDEVPEVIRRGTDPATRIPFFDMVFHGCVNLYWYWCDYNNKFPAIWRRRDLFNFVTGEPPMYLFTPEVFERQKEQIAKSYQTATKVAKATFGVPMSDYRFLSSDRMVQQSVFENGVVATVNFGQKPFTMSDGYVLEAEGCRFEICDKKK